MIVPRSRLLFWVAAVVLPFALLAGVEPLAAIPALAAIGGLVLLALLDAVGARSALTGIGLELPALARMSKDRDASLEVRLHDARRRGQTLRVALAWPREIPTSQEEALVTLPREHEWSRMVWPCRPRRRGKYRLERAYLETNSRLGFWAVRQAVPVRSEVRVYPNLLTERRNLAALFLHRGAFGLHAQRQVGKGRDFEKLREYIPGDSFDEIHWKATAKRGRPITKVYQIERTQQVYVVIDASRLSARPAEDAKAAPGSAPATTTLERFITAGLVLGLAAEQQGDLFGLLTFTDRVENFVRARNGKAHFSACREALYTLEPKVVTPDYDEVCTFIRLRLRRRALLVVLTSLDDPVVAESFVRNLDLIRRQHLVLVNMLPPRGVAPLFTEPNVAGVDDLYQRLGGHLQWQALRELEKVLQRRGVGFSLLAQEQLAAQLVAQYLSVKQRQLI